MLANNRVIYSDNGVRSDLTVSLNDYLSGVSVIPVVASQDAIYIGSDFPFNHRYIDVSVANDQASVASVALWNNSAWIPAVDVLDLTASSGVALAQSGILSWSIDRRNSSWTRQLSTEDIPALATFKIYDMYWARVSFSADLNVATALKYVGHRFSFDADLFNEYPEFSKNSLMNAFQSGKTNWRDQTLSAAEYIIQDLKIMGVVFSKNQILDWEIFRKASVHKTAEIIFRAFGEAYKDHLAKARSSYKESMNLKVFNVDQNLNARLDDMEKTSSTEFMSR